MPSDELDAKLARITGRIAARRAQAETDRDAIRQRIEHDPVLSLIADYAWNRTGPNGGFLWLRLPGLERGRDLPPGVVPAIPYEVKTLVAHKRRESRSSESETGGEPRKGPRSVARVLRPKRPRNLLAKKTR